MLLAFAIIKPALPAAGLDKGGPDLLNDTARQRVSRQRH
jgi:hypothetical protein